jgi:hypothetical protein
MVAASSRAAVLSIRSENGDSLVPKFNLGTRGNFAISRFEEKKATVFVFENQGNAQDHPMKDR